MTVPSLLTRIAGSTKRLAYAVAVGFCLGVALGVVVKDGLTQNVLDLLKATLYATAAAYGAGRFAEASEKKPEVPK